MKVLFLNPQGNFDPGDAGLTEHPDFGGQLVYVKELALALGSLGIEVDIVTRRFESEKWPVFSGETDSYPSGVDGADNVRIVRIPCGPDCFLEKEKLWPHLDDWTDRVIAYYGGAGFSPDVLAGHYADGGFVASQIWKSTGKPFTFTGHSLGAQKMDKLLKEKQSFEELDGEYCFSDRIAAECEAMKNASRIITSTYEERMIQYGHEKYNGAVDVKDDRRFTTVPPGVNIKLFGRNQKNDFEEEAITKLEKMLKKNIPAERIDLPIVICSSRLDDKKNHVGLVKAFAKNRKLYNSANLVLSIRGGENPLKNRKKLFKGHQLSILNEIAVVIKDGNIGDAVCSIEFSSQKKLAAGYRYIAREKSGVFALTAFHEPFGLAPLEAMAAGLACVATRNGGPSESLVDSRGEYGVLVDPFDPDDIANGILELVTSRKRWAQISDAGARRVMDKYTWSRTARGYLQVFNEILR